jgi:nitroreductase
MDSDYLLSTTRAVRRKLDLDRPVQTDVLMDCLRLAVQAPTPGGSEQWRWLIVRDQDKKNAIAELFREVGNAYLKGRAEAGATAKALASGQHLVDIIDRVPVYVIPCLGRVS